MNKKRLCFLTNLHSLFLPVIMLTSDTEFLNERPVPHDIIFHHVVEEPAPLTYQHQQAALSRMILLILFQMLG